MILLHSLELGNAFLVHPALDFVVNNISVIFYNFEVGQIGADPTLDALKPECFGLMLPRLYGPIGAQPLQIVGIVGFPEAASEDFLVSYLMPSMFTARVSSVVAKSVANCHCSFLC